jgi:hypothetical protein
MVTLLGANLLAKILPQKALATENAENTENTENTERNRTIIEPPSRQTPTENGQD